MARHRPGEYASVEDFVTANFRCGRSTKSDILRCTCSRQDPGIYWQMLLASCFKYYSELKEIRRPRT